MSQVARPHSGAGRGARSEREHERHPSQPVRRRGGREEGLRGWGGPDRGGHARARRAGEAGVREHVARSH